MGLVISGVDVVMLLFPYKTPIIMRTKRTPRSVRSRPPFLTSAPHLGHISAFVLTSFPHSLHFIKAIAIPRLLNFPEPGRG